MSKPKPIRTLTQEEIEQLREKTTENPGILPYGHHSGSALVKPEDKGKIKGRAVAAMHEQSSMQLKQIQEQVEKLMEQANGIKERVEVSERIYMAEIRFEPLIGKTYYLYQKNDGRDVLSLVAPREWGGQSPFGEFVATVRLLSDHTWQILSEE